MGEAMIHRAFLSCLIILTVAGFGNVAARADDKPKVDEKIKSDDLKPFGVPGSPGEVKYPVKLEPLFNGKDLTGFKVPEPNPWWKVVDGVLVGESDPAKKGHVLYTEKPYANFALEAEVRFPDDIDSGFMYGSPQLQVQLGVSRSLKKDMTASIYYKGKYLGQAQGVDKLLKLGEWNKIRIESRGRQSKVWLNGKHVLTWDCPDELKPGPIGLQIHGGVAMKVEFKDIKVGEIK
jgi:hypothetical protein